MRFVVPVLGLIALLLPNLAEAGRGIPIVRGTEQHLAFVAETDIRGNGAGTLALCHYYETYTVYNIGLWLTSHGYVLSDSNCEGNSFVAQPQLIAAGFSNGQIAADVPTSPAFTLRQRAEGHTWIAIGMLLIFAYGLKQIASSASLRRKSRMQERMEVLGLPDNAVFRFIDAMLHAANADGRAQPEEITFIREKATEIAQLDYTDEHIEWAIAHTDRLNSPRDFQRFGRGLTPEQARIVLRAALAVVAADGRMSRPERRFISQLTSGLMLDKQDVDRILRAPVAGAAQPA